MADERTLVASALAENAASGWPAQSSHWLLTSAVGMRTACE